MYLGLSDPPQQNSVFEQIIGSPVVSSIPGGSLLQGVVSFLDGLFGSGPPQSALDPNSPNYDPQVVALYDASARCTAAGGTLMTDGRCMVNGLDYFSTSWVVGRVYFVPGAEPVAVGGGIINGFDKSGADASYRDEDTRVELISPSGQVLTITGVQWKQLVASGAFNSDGTMNAQIVQSVTGAGIAPDGTIKQNNLVPLLLAGAAAYFLL